LTVIRSRGLIARIPVARCLTGDGLWIRPAFIAVTPPRKLNYHRGMIASVSGRAVGVLLLSLAALTACSTLQSHDATRTQLSDCLLLTEQDVIDIAPGDLVDSSQKVYDTIEPNYRAICTYVYREGNYTRLISLDAMLLTDKRNARFVHEQRKSAALKRGHGCCTEHPGISSDAILDVMDDGTNSRLFFTKGRIAFTLSFSQTAGGISVTQAESLALRIVSRAR